MSKSTPLSTVPRAILPQPWKPFKYMVEAVKFLLNHDRGALFLDPGLGKTSITLAAITKLIEDKQVNKVLVVAPLRPCYSVWPGEIQKWTDFRHLKHVVLHGRDKDKLLESDADVYIINPEGLDWLIGAEKFVSPRTGKVSVQVDPRRFKSLGIDLLVIDELSKFKSHTSQRFKAMKFVLPYIDRIWGLTGSPAANGLEGLFSQIYMLDGGQALGSYITQYRSQYFTPSHNGFSYDLQPGAEDRIYEAIAHLVLRMSARDYLDLPQLVENNIIVDLTPRAMKLYREVEDRAVATIDDKSVVSDTAAIALGKCRQVASGGLYYDPTSEADFIPTGMKVQRTTIRVHDEKNAALKDLVEELQGSPLLIGYEFNHDLERIKEALGKDVPFIGSGVSSKKASVIEAEWNAGRLPFLAGHPASMGHGLNLQGAGNHVAWYTIPWDFELYEQFIRRVLRQGNRHKRVFVHHLIARDTID